MITRVNICMWRTNESRAKRVTMKIVHNNDTRIVLLLASEPLGLSI